MASNLWRKIWRIHQNIIFMNVNLDGLTCMQKFEDITQVAIELDLIIFKEDLNLNTNSSQVYTIDTL
jgi:hypothetical protein